MNTEIVSAEQFFAPATTGPIDGLIAEYEGELGTIDLVASFMDQDGTKAAFEYFSDGHSKLEKNRAYYGGQYMFDRKYAVAAINSRYWQRALQLTDVLDYMPAKKRDAWHEQIREMKAPDFEEETVKATLLSMMNQRMDYLAEMVDGIFTGLSGEHVTNRPEGFGKRMIIDGVYSTYYSGHKEGLVHDMRCVIAKFMGRDHPPYGTTGRDLRYFRRSTGVWHNVDGGAFRIRVYKKGTAHIEINPDMAYRLNQILAYLHPMAIPAPHRTRPNAKRAKSFTMIHRPIPFAVLEQIAGKRIEKNKLELGYEWKKKDKHIRKAVDELMQAIGGAFVSPCNYVFDYDPTDVIGELVSSGTIPDQKSHQYYPTPETLALKAIEIADIGPDGKVLEPSAGQGGIADYLPKDRTTCVEISKLNCAILQAKGFTFLNASFLETLNLNKFDNIIMNPPFSEGRAKDHVEHAASMLADGGKLVAILPASFHGKDMLPGMQTLWHGPFENQFVGTSVAVTIMEVNK